MIEFINAKDFTAVPWLETSLIMRAHPQGIHFSKDLPNVIVGPNGSGKSALLRTISLLTLSHLVGYSAFDKGYLDKDTYWREDSRWRGLYSFLPGLLHTSDLAPAVFYRPNHIPGNERMLASAMMMGYFDEAKTYGELTRGKSSGQQSQLLQRNKVDMALAGAGLKYERTNWGYSDDMKVDDSRNTMPWEHKARILLDTYLGKDAGVPLVVMDEPEQSLDTRAKLDLWSRILSADVNAVQTIIATHSMYPFLHPEKFHIIEAVPGYVNECCTRNKALFNVLR